MRPDDEQFRWRTDLVEWEGEWGWHKATPQDLMKKVIPTLHDNESCTWAQLGGGSRHNHFISVDVIDAVARKRLEKVWMEDLPDKLVSLHIAGKTRVWGVRQGRICRLLWWDPEHTVYKVEKLRT